MRDVYVWIDPWAAERGDPPGPQPFTADEIASFQAAWNTWAANPRSIRFDAKTQDERDRLCLETGGVAGGIVDLGDGRFMASARAPTPDRSVPIWLLAIIMLGIAFGAPMIVGWVW